MPTFFFKFRTGKVIKEDPYGLDLPDLDAAREEAIQAAREILSDAVKFGGNDQPDYIIIFDEGDQCLSIVPLADALPQRLRK